jgi:hypothetical protein
MKFEYKKFDSTDVDFEKQFSEYNENFYNILSETYPNFYGKTYHSERIVKGKAVLYVAKWQNKLIAASYVKRNNRRGGIAVLKSFRRKGIATQLIINSLDQFPNQYTILSTNLSHSHKMLSLVKKLDFVYAKSIRELEDIVGQEFFLLKNFKRTNERLVFDRISLRRNLERKELTLMYFNKNR